MEEQSECLDNKQKWDTVIGIDPDTDKNGVAIIENTRKNKRNNALSVEFLNLRFWELIEFLDGAKDLPNCLIVIEKGEENSAMFNATRNPKLGKKQVAKIASCIGKNFQISTQLIELCELCEIEYRIYVPTTRKWSAADIKMMFGITQRTNPETRDALRAAYSCVR